MIKYLENRVWALNARIVKTDADADEVNNKLESLITDGIFAGGGLKFLYSENPIGNYSFRPVEVTLEFTEKAIQRFQGLVDEKEISFRLSSFRLIINTFGFLNIVPVFEYTGKVTDENLSDIEASGDAAAEIIDSIFDDIFKTVDILDTIGIIKKSSFYHFGVPSGIEKYGIHTKDDSYNYLVHIFFYDEKEALSKTVERYQAEEHGMTFENHRFFAVFPMYFWEMEKKGNDAELVWLTAIDSYMICETVAVNNSLHVYNSFLDVLNQNLDVDSNHLRKIFNYNTWQIQNLRLFNPNFTLHQFRFMKMYRQNSDIVAKYELYKDAEKSLSFAIEGMEVSRTQQSERVMSFILALFTALTLYSVITDVYALITSTEQSVPFSWHSLQTVIFVLETIVIASFILLFRRISKRM
ncbi:MAG TPA: hypothetical protein PLP88_01620 [Bacteroidales bacterium]|nr:hypothetical protein [Bacteroidales bacterium]